MSQFKIESDKKGNGYTLMVRHGVIKYKNFSGRPTRFNSEGGVRTVDILIDKPSLYSRLAGEGWNLKTDRIHPGTDDDSCYEPFAEKEDGKIAYPFTNLAIRFHHQEGEEWRDPKIYLHDSDEDYVGVLMSEDTLDELDRHYIKDFTMKIRPSKNMKGYLNEMHVWVENDPLDDDEGWDEYEDEIPFA